jgi:hypothetical protein
MPRLTWTTAPPDDAADYERVLREFAITMCPPKGKARLAEDGAVELFIDIRPSPGALSFGRRVREQQVYIASVCGTLIMRVRSAGELHTRLEDHYKVSTAQTLEDSGVA